MPPGSSCHRTPGCTLPSHRHRDLAPRSSNRIQFDPPGCYPDPPRKFPTAVVKCDSAWPGRTAAAPAQRYTRNFRVDHPGRRPARCHRAASHSVREAELLPLLTACSSELLTQRFSKNQYKKDRAATSDCGLLRGLCDGGAGNRTRVRAHFFRGFYVRIRGFCLTGSWAPQRPATSQSPGLPPILSNTAVTTAPD